MAGFCDDFIGTERDAQDRVIARKTAVAAIVNAFVRKINRREEAHRAAEILQCERARSLRHRLQLLVGLGSNQMFEAADELRFLEGQIIYGFDERHRHNFHPRARIGKRQSPMKKQTAASSPSGRRRRKCDCRSLEREINPAAHHSEVIVPTVDKVPAEIIYPADVGSETDFEAAADLADSFCLSAGVYITENVRAITVEKCIPFAAAKDRAATTENVGRKARAVERITQGQRAEDGTQPARIMVVCGDDRLRVKSPINLREIQGTSPGIHHPPFNTDAEVTVEKIFGIDTAAPSVVALDVAVISRIVPGKKISTPNIDVEFIIGVPLRTRRW